MSNELKFRYRIKHLDGRVHTRIMSINDIEGWLHDIIKFYPSTEDQRKIKILSRDQFVSACDVKGTEIYEHDIAEYKYLNKVIIAEVGEIEPLGVFLNDDRKTRLTHALNLGLRIIGNTYDNSELLKGGVK